MGCVKIPRPRSGHGEFPQVDFAQADCRASGPVVIVGGRSAVKGLAGSLKRDSAPALSTRFRKYGLESATACLRARLRY